MRNSALFIIVLLVYIPVSDICGQLKADTIFLPPLNIPVLLSATFAELRPNHLHSGIDFRTQGVTGHKVFSCEDGYVSRISVSPSGYGNALYINHPNGYTTVYGHLESFNDEITAYVKQQQYKREKFRVDLFPDSTLLPVRRGEVVGLSGNTGSSGGPHLHFEVRETKTEMPVNPMLFGFGVKDNIAPIMYRLAVYPIGEGSTVNGSAGKLILELEKSGRNYRIAGNKTIKIKGKAAFGVNTYDQTYGSANKCGPYNIKLWIDSLEVFSQTMNKFSFDESRYVNSLIDYAYYTANNIRFNRMYIEPNNRLSVYDHHVDRGIVSFADSAQHKAMVMVSDLHGNISRLNFSFSYMQDETEVESSPSFISDLVIIPIFLRKSYERDFLFQRQGIKVTIPANALYDEIDFEYNVSKRTKSLYSDVYRIHNIYTPLHKSISIEIAADSLPARLRDKALLARINGNEKLSNAGGTYKDGVVATSSGTFGAFAIAVDTIPPRIVPINIKNGANLRGVKNIRFKITDSFSGINTYNGWIDGQWALFEYDAKNDLIRYEFDAERLDKNVKHSLLLQVTDGKDNMAEYKADFFW